MFRRDREKTVSDTKTIKVIDSWKFSISKSRKRMYIDTTEYHAFPLELSRDDLQGVRDAMDQMDEIT